MRRAAAIALALAVAAPAAAQDGPDPFARNAAIRDAAFYVEAVAQTCLLYTSPSPRDYGESRMPSSA